MNKICSKCQIEKTSDCFKKSVGNKDGLWGKCKICSNEEQRNYRIETKNTATKKYEKTKTGFLVRLYRNMLSRISGVQKQKAHLYIGKDILSKKVFYNWAINDVSFNLLFADYENSGYDRKKAPSVDRINSKNGYSLDNMEFITHSENSRRGAISKQNTKYKKNGKYTKRVLRLNPR